MKRTCVDCGKVFIITPNEEQFYNSKGYDLPKRCKACRDKRSGKNLIKVKEKNPILTKLGILLMALAIVIGTLMQSFFKDSYFMLSVSIISAVLSLICLSIPRKTKTIDLSFSNKYLYNFYDGENLYKHYIKHGDETKSKSIEEYLAKANYVIKSKEAIHKQTVDNDTAYYINRTGEFVVVSPAKYIRTYYKADFKYYLKQ